MDSYLHHIAGVGRGIFSGLATKDKNLVQRCSTITVPQAIVGTTQLDRYAFGSDYDEYRLLNFGSGMMFNTITSVNVGNFWSVDSDLVPHPRMTNHSKPYTTYPDVDFSALGNISPGEELFLDYGEGWMDARNISFTEEPGKVYSRTLEDLSRSGHCLTDIEVRESSLAAAGWPAGRGLFSKRSYVKDEIVSISPVLLLPKHVFARPGVDTVLLNYMFSAEGMDPALLPIGTAAMTNHGGPAANMVVGWYNWETSVCGPIPENIIENSVEDIEQSSFSSFDFCYKAARAIGEKEELTIDYGEMWQEKWTSHQLDTGIFMQHIALPDNMIPESWKKMRCFGKHCKRESLRRLREIQNQAKFRNRKAVNEAGIAEL